MDKLKATRNSVLAHYKAYPQLQLQDILKFLYQSSFGCEHMLSSPEAAISGILRELEIGNIGAEAAVTPLDGNYSRVPLSLVSQGLCGETLGKLFFLSGQKESEGQKKLEEKLEVIRELSREGALPFSCSQVDEAIRTWASEGFPAVHHSEDFRSHYRPAYRVVANRYISFLPLFTQIDRLLEKGSAVIAIEGGSASGKSTLGQLLESLYGCCLIHMDDFFLQPHQRTPQRLQEPGGNVDRERFLSQIAPGLRCGAAFQYQRYDCSAGTLLPPEIRSPGRLTVVEGAYSIHPELAELYDFSVFLDIQPQLQAERIRKRNSAPMAERFFSEWIPLEKSYFTQLRVKERCDLIIPINGKDIAQ